MGGPAPTGVAARRATDVRRWLTTFLAVGAAYVLGAEAAWQSFGASVGLSFFPPAGVTLAALVLLDRRLWSAVIAAIVLAEIGVDLRHGLSLPIAAGYALANTVEPVVGATILRRWVPFGLDLGRKRDMIRFVAGGAGVGGAVGGVVGGLVKSTDSHVAWWDAALHWWASDGLSIVVIGGALLAVGRGRALPSLRAACEPLACVAVVAATAYVAFWEWDGPPSILVLPALVWAALRAPVAAMALACAVVAVVANLATAAGRGPLGALEMSAQSRVTLTQLFLASIILTVWFMAIEARERADAKASAAVERNARIAAHRAGIASELGTALNREITVERIASVVDSHLTRVFRTSRNVIGRFDPASDSITVHGGSEMTTDEH